MGTNEKIPDLDAGNEFQKKNDKMTGIFALFFSFFFLTILLVVPPRGNNWDEKQTIQAKEEEKEAEKEAVKWHLRELKKHLPKIFSNKEEQPQEKKTKRLLG